MRGDENGSLDPTVKTEKSVDKGRKTWTVAPFSGETGSFLQAMKKILKKKLDKTEKL